MVKTYHEEIRGWKSFVFWTTPWPLLSTAIVIRQLSGVSSSRRWSESTVDGGTQYRAIKIIKITARKGLVNVGHDQINLPLITSYCDQIYTRGIVQKSQRISMSSGHVSRSSFWYSSNRLFPIWKNHIQSPRTCAKHCLLRAALVHRQS